jgi:hypothetical protein
MFVNAILHQEVPVFDEKSAKFTWGSLGDSCHRVRSATDGSDRRV